jgi:hypothetical protein
MHHSDVTQTHSPSETTGIGGHLRRRSNPAVVTRICNLLAGITCLIALAGGVWTASAVFDRTPHVEDEVAFLFQARTFAEGMVLAPRPEEPGAFFAPFIVVSDEHWFGKYPPGFPLVLAVGARFGLTWLVNPVVGAGCIGVLYLAGRRLYDAPTGLLAAALLTSSPFFLLQAGSLMSHITSLFWVVAALLLFERASRDDAWWAALGCGAALGMLFLSRPLTGVGIGVPFAVWMLIDVVRDRRQVIRWLPAVVGALPFIAALMLYNQATTGDPFRSAYELWWPYDRIGFGEGVGRDGNYRFHEAIDNLRANSRSMLDWLFGWPWRLSLLPAVVAVGLLFGRLAPRVVVRLGADPRRGADRTDSGDRWDALNLGIAVSLALAYLAYWSDGQMYGPRYFFEMVGSLALLASRGIVQLAGGIGDVLARTAMPGARARALGLLLMLALTGSLVAHNLLNFAPQQFDTFTDWYEINRDDVRAVEAAELDNAVVFIEMTHWTDYAPFFSENSPTLSNSVVYAIDRGGSESRALMRHFPGRSAWRYADGRLERYDVGP